MRVSKTASPTSVRLPVELRKQLSQTAQKLGIKPAEIIRLAVTLYLERIEKEGKIEIPLRNYEKPSEGNTQSTDIS